MELSAHDIALGRGGTANNHEGNIAYREIVAMYKPTYIDRKLQQKDKKMIVKQVLHHLEHDGYRFVQKVGQDWVEAPATKVRSKVVQALREGAPKLIEEITADPLSEWVAIAEEEGVAGSNAAEGFEDDWVSLDVFDDAVAVEDLFSMMGNDEWVLEPEPEFFAETPFVTNDSPPADDDKMDESDAFPVDVLMRDVEL